MGDGVQVNNEQVGKCGRMSWSGTHTCGVGGYECPNCRTILAQREIDAAAANPYLTVREERLREKALSVPAQFLIDRNDVLTLINTIEGLRSGRLPVDA